MTKRAPPRQRHSATSAAAADGISPDLSRLRRIVYRALVRAGKRGLTDHEGDDRLRLGGSTYRPRRIELVEKGLVRASGAKRKTPSGRLATVWIAA